MMTSSLIGAEMKTVLSLLFVFGVNYSQGSYWHRHDNVYDTYPALSPHNYYDKRICFDHLDDRKRQDHQNDDHIVRPCCLHDISCIRRSLAYYTGCLPTYGPIPEPSILTKLPLYLPHANITFTANDVQVKGLSFGRIEEFYINIKTSVLILEVVFDSIGIYSPMTVITYHQKGKEPVKTTDYVSAEHRKLSLTLVIQSVHDKYQAESHVYSYLADSNISLEVGPGLEAAPEGANMEWATNVPLSVKEALVVEGPAFLNIFLQNNICDFRIH